jgi:hypothetical protein
MRKSTKNVTREAPPSVGQKVADKIDLEPAQMKNHGGRFFYHPSEISPDVAQNIKPKNTDEYLHGGNTLLTMQQPQYEKEELVFDKESNTWKLVKESEMYKYQS